MDNWRQAGPVFLVDELNVPRHQPGHHGGRCAPVKPNLLRPCDYLASSLSHHTGSVRSDARVLGYESMYADYVFKTHGSTSGDEALLYPFMRLSGIGKGQRKLSNPEFIFAWVFVLNHRLAQVGFGLCKGLFAPFWGNNLE